MTMNLYYHHTSEILKKEMEKIEREFAKDTHDSGRGALSYLNIP